MCHRSRPPLIGDFLSRADRLVARLSTVLVLCLAPALSAQVKVMTNGDSITFGVGASDTNTQSYSAELARLLGSGYYVQKDGTGGATMLKKGQPSFWNTQGVRITTEMNPSIIYIMLGTNDSKRNNWTYRDEYIGDYLALIDTYRVLPAKPQIYIGLPPPATASDGDVSGPIVANEVIPRILEVARQRDVKIVDVHTPFLEPFRSLLPDGIHPNDEGHRVIARTVRDAIVDGRVWRAVPAPWQRTDIGATGYAGGDAVDQANVFQVLGGGSTIGDGADAFRFVHQAVTGDVEVSARVLGQRNVDPLVSTRSDAAAGVMVREGTAANARHASVVATPGNGVSFRWRDASGASGGATTVSGVGSPVWVRVSRSGNSFAGYYSNDGSSWTRIGAARSIAMAGAAQAGLAANSALGNTLAHARFGQVQVSGVSTPPGGGNTGGGDTGGGDTGGETPVSAALTATFDPNGGSGRTLANGAFSALFDPARTTWRFATDQAERRPLRAVFPGTARDALTFDGTRALSGPRAQDLFVPGVDQDLGLVAAVHVPAGGGSGKALILSINKSDTESAVALGYDFSQGRFYALYPNATNGATEELAGTGSPRGAAYVVRLQKTGGVLRLRVDGALKAETSGARGPILASGEGAALALGGLRPLNPQFVGHVGKFYLRRGSLSDSQATAHESDLRAWAEANIITPPPPPPHEASASRPLGARSAWVSDSEAGSYRLGRDVNHAGPYMAASATASRQTALVYEKSSRSPATSYPYTVATTNGEAQLQATRRKQASASAAGSTGLRSWRMANGLPFDGSGRGADTVDVGGLGVPNLVRYALGMSAYESSLSRLPRLGTDGTRTGLRFERRLDRSDIDYLVEGSPDLSEGSWVVLAQSIRGAKMEGVSDDVMVTESGGGAVKDVRVETTAAGGDTTRYLRLNVRR